jgi:ribosomal protein L37AE/L43A
MDENKKPKKFCPKCGSANITFAVFYGPSIWKCLDCGYEGAFVVEDSSLAQKTREDRKQFAQDKRNSENP